MSDIVERLRKAADQAGMLLSDPPKPSAAMALYNEAADEITRLRELFAGYREESCRQAGLDAEVIDRLRQELAEAREDCTRANEMINAAVTDYNEAVAEIKARSDAYEQACRERDARFRFSGGDGELLFEIPNCAIVSVEPDGAGYTIFDAARGVWVSGRHECEQDINAAGLEIAAAIRSIAEKEPT